MTKWHLFDRDKEGNSMWNKCIDLGFFLIKGISRMLLTHVPGVLQWECWKYLPLLIPLKKKRNFLETFGYFLSKKVGKWFQNIYVVIFCFKRFFGHVSVVTEYFGSMRHLLEAKVPQSLDKSPTPPTPQAESIFNMIISPIQFAVMSKDKEFR